MLRQKLLVLCTAFRLSIASVPSTIGSDVAPAVSSLLSDWFAAAPPLPDRFSGLTIALGDAASDVISDEEILALSSSEGFLVKANADCSILAARGGSSRGHSFAGYHLLEFVGVSFMHPLAPTVAEVSPLGDDDDSAAMICGLDVTESPHWQVRAWHYHTQHPLELTDVLNGFDSVVDAEDDQAGPEIVPWEDMLPQVTYFYQWALANRLNCIEWLLLYADAWADFADSTERQQRLRILTDLARNLTLTTSADVPIALRQQHSWYMIKNANDADWAEQIDQRVAWVLNGAGFDMLGTESGSTEFTHSNCSTMLSWINHTAQAVASWGKQAFIKCHCSDAGTCPEYDNLNFNFLPALSDMRMGLLPHTVQTFGFDDPTSGSYGNTNFSYMFEWMEQVGTEQPERSILFYGETAYWVNFDINVPLFLPMYADRRISDLRQMKGAEEGSSGAVQFNGQLNFCSGWEWGYWLHEVAVARASWSVLSPSEGTQEDALRAGVAPVVRALTGSNATAAALLADFLVGYVASQNALLINGSQVPDPASTQAHGHEHQESSSKEEGGEEEEVPKESPSPFGPTYQLNGHAYLEGWEAVADLEYVGNTLGLVGANTQPAHVSLRALMHDGGGAVNTSAAYTYASGVKPLLEAMHSSFYSAFLAFSELWQDSLNSSSGSDVDFLWSEISDSLQVTALRAEQVMHTYEAAFQFHRNRSSHASHLHVAQAAIEAAAEVVQRRELSYRAPKARIASWRNPTAAHSPPTLPNTTNPTAYTFGYLWTASSLLYWWRDFGIVNQSTPEARSPCYLNYQNPVDIALGQGNLQDLAQAVENSFKGDVPADFVTDCLAAPEQEWVLPEDL